MFHNDPLEINDKEWAELLTDPEVTTEPDLNILTVVYESKDHELRAAEIASRLNISHHAVINLQVSRFGKRVIAKTGIQPPVGKGGKPWWWHIPFLGYHKKAGGFPWIMRPELVTAFENVVEQVNSEIIYSGEIVSEDARTLTEGTVRQLFANRYERNRRARNMCIAHHGSQCAVCGFDFEKTYGPIGKYKIHVHHLIPLSQVQQKYKVDPVHDLCPVCPNCHLIIHSKKEAFTVEEVKEMIRESGLNIDDT